MEFLSHLQFLSFCVDRREICVYAKEACENIESDNEEKYYPSEKLHLEDRTKARSRLVDVFFDKNIMNRIQGESHGSLFFFEIFLDVLGRLMVFFFGEIVDLISHAIFFNYFVVIFDLNRFRCVCSLTDFLETELTRHLGVHRVELRS